ncbi:hypothetical protein Bbelb_292090 [Branchiostoma belcheri]|nr:hypothetical protein Bbelb_292090 [Branchiostoma belcheri]
MPVHPTVTVQMSMLASMANSEDEHEHVNIADPSRTDGRDSTADPSRTDGSTSTADPSRTDGSASTADPSRTNGRASTADPSGTDGRCSTANPSKTDRRCSTADPSRTDGSASTADPSGTDGRCSTADPSRTDGSASTADPSRTDGRASTADPSRTNGSASTADPSRTDGSADTRVFEKDKFKVLAFGLSNAPPTEINGNCLERFTTCLAYLDDNITYFEDDTDVHLNRLRAVFQRYMEANLKLNPQKCKLFVMEHTLQVSLMTERIGTVPGSTLGVTLSEDVCADTLLREYLRKARSMKKVDKSCTDGDKLLMNDEGVWLQYLLDTRRPFTMIDFKEWNGLPWSRQHVYYDEFYTDSPEKKGTLCSNFNVIGALTAKKGRQDTVPQPQPLQDTVPQPQPLQDTVPQPQPLQDTVPQPQPLQDTVPTASTTAGHCPTASTTAGHCPHSLNHCRTLSHSLNHCRTLSTRDGMRHKRWHDENYEASAATWRPMLQSLRSAPDVTGRLRASCPTEMFRSDNENVPVRPSGKPKLLLPVLEKRGINVGNLMAQKLPKWTPYLESEEEAKYWKEYFAELQNRDGTETGISEELDRLLEEELESAENGENWEAFQRDMAILAFYERFFDDPLGGAAEGDVI